MKCDVSGVGCIYGQTKLLKGLFLLSVGGLAWGSLCRGEVVGAARLSHLRSSPALFSLDAVGNPRVL